MDKIIKVKDTEIKIIGELPFSQEIREYYIKYKEKHPRTFNGVIFSAEKLNPKNDTLEIEVKKGYYEHFLYSEAHEENINPLGVEILIETKDHYLILSKMSSWTYTPGLIKTVGGNIDDADFVDKIHPEKTAIREIKEELNIDIEEKNLSLDHLYYNPKGYLTFCYRGIIPLTKNEVQERFQSWQIQDQEQELTKLIFIQNTREDIEEGLEKYPEISIFVREWLREVVKELNRDMEK